MASSPSPLASPIAATGPRPAAWLLEACFPFWSDRAVHPLGGFRERLTVEGGLIDEELSRVRVQARQTLLFARAALLGWRPALSRRLVQAGVDTLLGPCRRADGLVGRVVRHGGGLADAQPELYDNAFAMMALAWAARALEAPELIVEADLMLDQLDLSHAHPAGGYHETLPPRSPRRQNPHMHLFEACLALYAASGAERHAVRAATLLELFETRFLERSSGCIREHLTDRLEPIATSGGMLIEPGHAFEWIALIEAFRRLGGASTPEYVPSLYAASLSTLHANGAAPMLALCSGAAVEGSRRIWAQSETLRAHLARASAGDEAAADRARRQIDQIFASHLDPAPAGGWIDHVDADGRPLVDDMTAATGYHLVTAFAEAAEHPATGGGSAPEARGGAAA